MTTTEVKFLTVSVVVNPRQGVAVIITEGLPEIYLVKFRLTGRVAKSGKFMVDLIYPLDGFPVPSPREVGHLVQALNEAAAAQLPMPVSAIQKPMIQTDDIGQLPRRMLRMAPGS